MSTISELLATRGSFRSQRITKRPDLAAGATMVLADLHGAGCIRHWWLTYGVGSVDNPAVGRALRLRITVDDAYFTLVTPWAAHYCHIGPRVKSRTVKSHGI